MRNMTKKKAGDARRHAERMASDLDYRMRKLFNTIVARCKPNSRRRDREWYAEKGLAVTITVKDLVNAWHRDGAAKMLRPTVDRKESDRGYEPDNIQFLEHADNLRKMIPTRRRRRTRQEIIAATQARSAPQPQEKVA